MRICASVITLVCKPLATLMHLQASWTLSHCNADYQGQQTATI